MIFPNFFLQKIWRLKNNRYLCIAIKKNDGAIAQLVEQRTENPCVPGSIPGGTTFRKRKIMKPAEIQSFQRVFSLPTTRRNMQFGAIKNC